MPNILKVSLTILIVFLSYFSFVPSFLVNRVVFELSSNKYISLLFTSVNSLSLVINIGLSLTKSTIELTIADASNTEFFKFSIFIISS